MSNNKSNNIINNSIIEEEKGELSEDKDEISSIEGFIEENNLKIDINKTNLKESIKSVLKNNYWNEEHEDILRNLKKFTNFLAREYQQAYWKYRSKLQIYRIPIIIMSSLSGFLSISNSGYIPPEYNKWASLLVGFVNLMVTVITLIENFKKIDTNMNKSFSAHVNFKQLHDEIAIMLRVPAIERAENGNDTIARFFSRYQSYLLDAPVIKKITNNLLECPLESKIYQDLEEKAKTSSSTMGLLKTNRNFISKEREDLESGFCIKTQVLNKLGMNDNTSTNTSYNPIPTLKKGTLTKNLKIPDSEIELTNSENKGKPKLRRFNTISNINTEAVGSEEMIKKLNNDKILNIEFMDKNSPKVGKKLQNIRINEDS